MKETFPQIRRDILKRLIGGSIPDDMNQVSPLDMAKAGILHLLATREHRRLRFTEAKEYEVVEASELALKKDNDGKPKDPSEDMSFRKIMSRLLSAQIQAYLLDPDITDRNLLVDNPYALTDIPYVRPELIVFNREKFYEAEIQIAPEDPVFHHSKKIAEATAIVRQALRDLIKEGKIADVSPSGPAGRFVIRSGVELIPSSFRESTFHYCQALREKENGRGARR